MVCFSVRDMLHFSSPNLYLDANATTAVLPAAQAAAQRAMQQQFGNPSSSHTQGLVAKALLEQVRSLAMDYLDVGPGRLVFNSGATEGIQTAVLSALCAVRERRNNGQAVGRCLVYGATEHKAVPQCLAHWNTVLGLDLELRALPVDSQGLHDLAVLAEWLPDTALLCTMAANNETGVVSDLAAIEQVLESSQSTALWLVDGVQALGKLPLRLQHSRIDYAPFSGHKLYAPKGVGLLYVRAGAPYTPLVVGGGQEGGWRSGTENMPGIAALGAVFQALQRGDTFASLDTLQRYRSALENSLRSAFPDVVFNAPLDCSLPTTLNFSVPSFSSKALMDVLDAAGLRVSAGSACSAASATPSYVLQAMGLPLWRTASAVRLSIGALADQALIDQACAAIARCAQALQSAAAQAAPQPPATAAHAQPHKAEWSLQWADLPAFLDAHSEALLVDVREEAEHQICNVFPVVAHALSHAPARLEFHHIPLSQLEQHRSLTLQAPTVVFVCRSGKRSLQAAQWLHRQGHTAVHHLHGGFALSEGAPLL